MKSTDSEAFKKEDVIELCKESYLAGHDHAENGFAPLENKMLIGVIKKVIEKHEKQQN